MSEEQVPEVAPVPKSNKRITTPEKWDEIEKGWTHGKFATLADLAAHHKVTIPALMKRFKVKKIRRGQAIDEYNRKVQEELEKKAAEDAKILVGRIQETKEDHYKYVSGIVKLTWGELLKAKQDGKEFSVVKANVQALESVMKVMKMAREERFAILGLDRAEVANDEEDGLPELVVSELSQGQIEEMRARDTDPDKNDEDDMPALTGDMPIDPDAADDDLDLDDLE